MNTVGQDLESAAVSLALGVAFDHDGGLYGIAHVLGLVGFDAHLGGLLADSLAFAGERVIAIGSVIAVGSVDDSARRRGFV